MKKYAKGGKAQESPKKRQSGFPPNFKSPQDSVQSARRISQHLRNNLDRPMSKRPYVMSDMENIHRVYKDLEKSERFYPNTEIRNNLRGKYSQKDYSEIKKRAILDEGRYGAVKDFFEPAKNYDPKTGKFKSYAKGGKIQEPPKKKASAPKPNFSSPRDSVQNARDISHRLRLYRTTPANHISRATPEARKEDDELLKNFLDKRGFGGPNNKFSQTDKEQIVKRVVYPFGYKDDMADPASNYPDKYKKGGKMPTTYAKGGKTPLPGMKKPKSSSCK